MSHGKKNSRTLLEDSSKKLCYVLGDKLSHVPQSFSVIAATPNAPLAAIVHDTKPIYGIQFHPEVTHTPKGTDLLRNFAVEICEARQHWTMEEFVEKEIAKIRALVGENGQVIGAVSGGVDSTVAAKLIDKAKSLQVDNGLLRQDEAKIVHKTLTEDLGIRLTVVDASQRFLTDLRGVIDPEQKRRIIGRNFIQVFQEEAKTIEKAAADSPLSGDIEWLLQGTLYPDVIESISFKGPSATIKTHHNVGGLPSAMHLKLIEPLRELFKEQADLSLANFDTYDKADVEAPTSGDTLFPGQDSQYVSLGRSQSPSSRKLDMPMQFLLRRSSREAIIEKYLKRSLLLSMPRQ
ncbi:MAG: hypothetical protein Q9164_006684 [Protoblastenia rupestris]